MNTFYFPVKKKEKEIRLIYSKEAKDFLNTSINSNQNYNEEKCKCVKKISNMVEYKKKNNLLNINRIGNSKSLSSFNRESFSTSMNTSANFNKSLNMTLKSTMFNTFKSANIQESLDTNKNKIIKLKKLPTLITKSQAEIKEKGERNFSSHRASILLNHIPNKTLNNNQSVALKHNRRLKSDFTKFNNILIDDEIQKLDSNGKNNKLNKTLQIPSNLFPSPIHLVKNTPLMNSPSKNDVNLKDKIHLNKFLIRNFAIGSDNVDNNNKKFEISLNFFSKQKSKKLREVIKSNQIDENDNLNILVDNFKKEDDNVESSLDGDDISQKENKIISDENQNSQNEKLNSMLDRLAYVPKKNRSKRKKFKKFNFEYLKYKNKIECGITMRNIMKRNFNQLKSELGSVTDLKEGLRNQYENTVIRLNKMEPPSYLKSKFNKRTVEKFKSVNGKFFGVQV